MILQFFDIIDAKGLVNALERITTKYILPISPLMDMYTQCLLNGSFLSIFCNGVYFSVYGHCPRCSLKTSRPATIPASAPILKKLSLLHCQHHSSSTPRNTDFTKSKLPSLLFFLETSSGLFSLFTFLMLMTHIHVLLLNQTSVEALGPAAMKTRERQVLAQLHPWYAVL